LHTRCFPTGQNLSVRLHKVAKNVTLRDRNWAGVAKNFRLTSVMGYGRVLGMEAMMSIERILDWHNPVALLLVILVLFLGYNRIVQLEERVRVLQGDVFVLQTLHESRALEGSAERGKR